VSTAPPSQRIPYFDNARFLLIVLVAVGHAVEPAVSQVAFLRHLHIAIYTFHVPLLAALSGVFARRARRGLVRDVTDLLIPYLVFQILYSVADLLAGGRETLHISLLTPTFLTWYLLSLFAWRWLARLVEGLPLALPLVFLVGIGAGYLEPLDYRLSLSRTVVFFPFFLIGARLPRDAFTEMTTKWFRIAGGLFLALLLAEIVWWDPQFDLHWLYGGIPYSGISTGAPWIGGVVRAGFYALACVAGAAFLSLVPRGRRFFTVWGARSLGAYLLHGLLVEAAIGFGVYELDLSQPWRQAALVAAAVAVAMVLSSRPAFATARALGGQSWLGRWVAVRFGGGV
jgi:fucose 4-O-acetylase-like acetyltransferase